MDLLVRIDPCDEPLTSGLFVACRPIDLPSKVESLYDLTLQGMVQLGGVEEVIFDGVAWAVEAHITQLGYLP